MSLIDTEQALKSLGIEYQKNADGALVATHVDLSGRGLNRLPDLSAVIVYGDFSCDDNLLTSLKGVPRLISGNFSCDRNQLSSLEHGPHSVGRVFSCRSNRLASLEGVPPMIVLDLVCDRNQLISLEHAPRNFKNLVSDFGEFRSWREVPDRLRTSDARQRESAAVIQQRLQGHASESPRIKRRPSHTSLKH